MKFNLKIGNSTEIDSLAGWDQKLEEIGSEAASIQAEMARLSAAIAEEWDDDTTPLENEYARLSARLQAIQNVRMNTLKARREWYKGTLVEWADGCMKRATEAHYRAAEIKAEIESLEARLAILGSEYNRQLAIERHEIADNLLTGKIGKVEADGYPGAYPDGVDRGFVSRDDGLWVELEQSGELAKLARKYNHPQIREYFGK